MNLTTPMQVLTSFSLLHSIHRDDPQPPSLKEKVVALRGSRLRRIDRYIEFCLLGGLSCAQGQELPEDTAVYMATRGGTVATTSQAMAAIYEQHQPPKPLHFINTLGNTACFHLTKELNISGQAMVVAQEHLSFEAALFQAVLDMQLGVVDTALVGGIDEVVFPAALHARRLGEPAAENLLEGSHWLLLSKQQHQTQYASVTRPEYLLNIEQVLQWLSQQPAGAVHFCCSLSEAERQQLTGSDRRLVDASAAHLYDAVPHGVYSGSALIKLLESPPNAEAFAIHLARTGDTFCAVLVSRNG